MFLCLNFKYVFGEEINLLLEKDYINKWELKENNKIDLLEFVLY